MKDKLISRNSLVEFANNSTVGIDANDIMRFPTIPAIPIPDNATNGDMIKVLFSNVKWWVNEDNEVFTDHKTINSNRVAINVEWWNSPYKRGDKE